MQSRPSATILRALSLALTLTLVFAATAAAKQTHLFETTFGAGELTLSGNAGVGVNSTSHDVYVAAGTDVAQFEADGTPVRTFGSLTSASFLAIDNSGGASNGSVYVVTGGGSVAKFAANGTVESGWGTGGVISGLGQIAGIAVGAGGKLFVLDTGSTMHPFTAAGAAQPTFTAPRGTAANGLALDSAGNFYKVDGIPEVTKFDSSGQILSNSLTRNSNATALGIDGANDDLYVAETGPTSVFEFAVDCGEACASKDHFGEGQIGSAGGVAVDPATKVVFVTDVANSEVVVFSAPVLVPNATLKATTAIGRAGATFNGEVGADGGPQAECEFEYVSRAHFTSEGFKNPETAACDPAGPFTGSSTQAVSATVTGLSSSTEYLVHLVASNANGPSTTSFEAFTTTAALSLSVSPASQFEAHAATLNGSVNPEGAAVEECVFEYGKNYEFDKSAACAESSGEIGTGNAPVAVHAAATGLEAGTEYQFRLHGKNSFGSETTFAESFFSSGPRIAFANVEPKDTSAEVKGSINPGRENTTYFFEYVTQAEFESGEYAGAKTAPVGGAPIGSGNDPVEVQQELAGLQPLTTYHFRLVATSPESTVRGNDLTFKTYPPSSSGLPDGRAYEQATPSSPFEKNGNNLLGDDYNMLYSSPDGNATTFYAVSGAADTESSVQYPTYIARRGSENWSSEGINPPATLGPRARSLAYTHSLSGAYTLAWTSAKAGSLSLVLRERGGKLYTIFSGQDPVVSAPNARSTAETTSYASETSDGSEVLIESPAALTADAVEGDWNLYLWSKATGKLTLVDVLDGGAPPAGGAFAGAWDYNTQSEENGGGSHAQYYVESSLSRNGSRVFFTTSATPHQIYLRENPTSPAAKTIQISASQKTNGSGDGTDPRGTFSADFLEATPDGSVVFFKSHEDLTNDAETGGEEDQDLYSYDVASGALTDLTAASGTEEARVRGLLGASDDGSYVYFVARGALAPGSTEGANNVYVSHGGQIQFITELSSADVYAWFNTRLSGSSFLPQKSSRVTPDGKTISFTSQLERPEFMNNEHFQVYRWEFGGSGLQCISCSPTGVPATHDSSFRHLTEYFVAPSFETAIASRNLSINGKRIAFATPERLVASDVNGVEDVYEWEKKGEGSCTSEEDSGGCVYLLSTGTSPDPSFLSDMSEDGSNVFFFTTQRLVGQDKDELSDVYDARIGGGLLAQNAEPPRPCEGEACLGAGTASAPPQGRGTTTFAGSGNEKPKKKKKHKKKKHHKKRHHKKHHKNGKKKGHQRQGGGNR